MRPFLCETVPRVVARTVTSLLLFPFHLVIGVLYLLWCLLRRLPHILYHTSYIALLALYVIGTAVVRNLEKLVYVLLDHIIPPAWVFRSAGQWIVAVLEAAFVTDEEIERRAEEACEMEEYETEEEMEE